MLNTTNPICATRLNSNLNQPRIKLKNIKSKSKKIIAKKKTIAISDNDITYEINWKIYYLK